MTPETLSAMNTLKQALLTLSGNCDGASSHDKVGFNKPHSVSREIKRAISWAQGESKLSYTVILSVLDAVQIYQKQLQRAGIELPGDIPELRKIVEADKSGRVEVADDSNSVEFEGHITRVFFGPKETGFVIMECSVDKVRKGDMAGWLSVKVKGVFQSAKEGVSVLVGGSWNEREETFRGVTKMVKQIDARSILPHVQMTMEGIVKWLTTIPGVGTVTATRIVEHFGLENVMSVLSDTPERIGEVKGIGDKATEMVAFIRENKAAQDLDVWLTNLGINGSRIEKIRAFYKVRDKDPKTEISKNPYELIQIETIGFAFADKVAMLLGIPRDSPFRIAAAVQHSLSEKCNKDGHCFVDRGVLAVETQRLIGADISTDMAFESIEAMLQAGSIIEENGGIWPMDLWTAEVEVAETLVAMMTKPVPAIEDEEIYKKINEWQERTGMRLHEVQEHAVFSAINNRVMVLTGGPGTGKTSTTRAIVDMLSDLGMAVALCAPTGRAARRLANATGRPAQTIHRLIGSSSSGSGTGSSRGCGLGDADVVLVDENTMTDIQLMRALIRGMYQESRIIMVGDVDQLPSVGPGRVLKDIIDSSVIPVVRLTQIFRQKGNGPNMIVDGAHAINHGVMPELDIYSGPQSIQNGKMLFLDAPDDQAIKESVVNVMTDIVESLHERDSEDDAFDISQVLTPQKSTDSGVEAINEAIQNRFNQKGEPLTEGGWLRLGDKVMQTTNNYDLAGGDGVPNGTVGTVMERLENGEAKLNMEGVRVVYPKNAISELTLCYACTIHKSQGSEYSIMIGVVSKSHRYMLNRQLLYTAVTRGKSTVILVGQRQAIQLAVSNTNANKRNTWLAERIRRLVRQSSARSIEAATARTSITQTTGTCEGTSRGSGPVSPTPTPEWDDFSPNW